MVCIVCFGEECEFSYKCSFQHEATCQSCLKVFLSMNVHKIFQSIGFRCTFCYENVSVAATDADGFMAIDRIRLDDFGIKQNEFPTHTGLIVSELDIQRRIKYAVDHYAFDILKGIALSRPRTVDERELFNAMEYFHGLRSMIRRIRSSIRRPFTTENMKQSQIAMIESSIIIVTNELNALDALDLVPVRHHHQQRDQQEVQASAPTNSHVQGLLFIPEELEDGECREEIDYDDTPTNDDGNDGVDHLVRTIGRKRKIEEIGIFDAY